jgi:hypothetical protein
MRALIGHTGFVGAQLRAAGGFTQFFNSSSIESMRGRSYEEVVCAATPSAKYLANQDPEADRAAIGRLLAVLETVRTQRFTLISTVEVYPDPSQPLDESSDLTDLSNHPYGAHRLEVEKFVAARFPVHHIVRLPALFGDGLKKNALFDLLHDYQVEKLNPLGIHQWYPTRRLAGDLARITAAGLQLVNLVTEPLPIAAVIARFFPDTAVGPAAEPAPRYGLRTRHAALFGGTPPYVMGVGTVLAAMTDFIAATQMRLKRGR